MPAHELPERTKEELHLVNRCSRIALGMIAVFAGWQVWWIYDVRPNVEAAIPGWQATGVWLVLWFIVGVTCAAAALAGSDMIARLGFGTTAVVSAMAAATVLVSASNTEVVGYTMTGQFYGFGQAVLLSALSFDMLISPLRTIPPEMSAHNFRKVADDGRD